MNLTLPPEFENYVGQEVASGKYQSAEEVVCEALRLLQERAERLEALRRDIQAGYDQLERGEFIDLEDDQALREFFDDIKARGRQRLQMRLSGQ